MKIKLIITALLITAGLLPLYAGSRILFERTTHDFGTVKQETSLYHTFKFKNRGSDILIIDRIRAG